MAGSAESLICEAIGRLHVLSFDYKGGWRTADPYILGYDDKGRLVLAAVQRSGGSGRGFRSYDVDGLSNLVVTDQKFFGNHPDYNPRDHYFERVICQVKPRE